MGESIRLIWYIPRNTNLSRLDYFFAFLATIRMPISRACS
jgi:hypothetical protein